MEILNLKVLRISGIHMCKILFYSLLLIEIVIFMHKDIIDSKLLSEIKLCFIIVFILPINLKTEFPAFILENLYQKISFQSFEYIVTSGVFKHI